MGITEKILLVLFAVFALLAVLRLFAAPLKLAGKLLVNTLLAAKAFDPLSFHSAEPRALVRRGHSGAAHHDEPEPAGGKGPPPRGK